LSRLNILPMSGRGCCTLVSTLPVWKREPMRLCMHPIRTPPITRLPDIEKSWKSHVPSREMLCQKVTIIFRKTDINCMKSYTDRGLTPGQDSKRIVLSCHNILTIIVHMAVSSICDSGALVSVYRTDIAWSHCSQNFPRDGCLISGPHVDWNFFDSDNVHFSFIIPSIWGGSLAFAFTFWDFNKWTETTNSFLRIVDQNISHFLKDQVRSLSLGHCSIILRRENVGNANECLKQWCKN
jgi:hypothetical protein